MSNWGKRSYRLRYKNIELVNRGILYGTFTCPTGGKEAIDYAIKILNKEEVPKKVILKWKIITKE